MDPHSPNKLFATKYCFLILGDDSSFFFLIISLFLVFFFILCYFVIINFYKNYVIIIILFNYYFFMKITFIFSCSGMFRNVPCSWSVLSTPNIKDDGSTRGLLATSLKELPKSPIRPSGSHFCSASCGECWFE